MIAYEIYQRNPEKGYELIAVMPERRLNLVRVTQESVTSLGRTIIGENLDIENFFVFQVEMEESTGKVLRMNQHFMG